MNTWPDGGMTPFRGEKNSNWEGAYRVPAVVRWPGRIAAGAGAQRDRQPQRLVPDLLAAAGVAGHRRPLKAGAEPRRARRTRSTSTATTSWPYLTGEVDESPRRHFFYVSDDGDLTAVRFDNWKVVFLEQRAPGTLQVWAEPFTELRVPKIFNLRTDPYERADITSNTYYDWLLDHAWVVVPDAGRTWPRCSRPSPSSRRARSRPASASTR